MREDIDPVRKSSSAAGALEASIDAKAQVIQPKSEAERPFESDQAVLPLSATTQGLKREHSNATLRSTGAGSDEKTGPVPTVADIVTSPTSNETVHRSNSQLSSGRLVLPNLIQPLPPKAASQIAIRLEAAGDSGQVELRIHERNGEVRIDVRSNDVSTAASLRLNLGDLVKRLDLGGFGSELIHRDSDFIKQPNEHVQHFPGDDSSQGYSFLSDNSHQHPHHQNQASQQEKQPDGSDDALEELRSIFNDFTKDF